MSLITDKFEELCRLNAKRPAIHYIESGKLQTKSFEEMYNEVLLMCSYLRDKGVKEGDRILGFASSNYKLCVFMLASLNIGASVMYVDIFAKQEKLKKIFAKYKPGFVLVSDRTRMLKPFFREINKIEKIINIDGIKDYKYKDFERVKISEDAPALITSTTGTTGTPKLFVRSHGDLYSQLKLITDNITRNVEDEVVLTTSYIYVFANILQGFTTVLPNLNLGSGSDRKLKRKLLKFKDLAITMILTSPDFCLRTPNMYPKLRTLYFGGAILNYNEAKQIIDKYSDCNIIYIYGSTECNVISTVELSTYISTLETYGKCLLGNACKGVKIRSDENKHILVKSEALLTKCLDAIEIKDGYYDTNDIGILENGSLVYLGKAGHGINIGGSNVYSNEIEQQVILKFKNISKCAMLESHGKYYLFVENSEELEEIKAFIADRYKIDADVITLKRIPRDIKHHTKINYRKLEGKKYGH